MSIVLLAVSGCKQKEQKNKKNSVSIVQQQAVDTKQILAGYMLFPDLPLDAQSVCVQEVTPGSEISVGYDSCLEQDYIVQMYVRDMEWLGWDLVMQHQGNDRSVLTYRAPVWDCVIIIDSIEHKKVKSKVQIVQTKKSSW